MIRVIAPTIFLLSFFFFFFYNNNYYYIMTLHDYESMSSTSSALNRLRTTEHAEPK